MRDPEGQILPSGISWLSLWPGTGMLGPLPAMFQAVPLPAGMAPATSPSHREGCGPPQPGSTDFPNWGKKKKKKKDAGRRGQGGGCIFLVFFWGRTRPAALAKWKKTVRACLVHWAGRQPLGWPQLGQTGGVSRWSRASGEVQVTRSPCGSTWDTGAVGDPSLGCCGLAVPGTGMAAPVGVMSGGIFAPVGSRSRHAWVGRGQCPGAAEAACLAQMPAFL